MVVSPSEAKVQLCALVVVAVVLVLCCVVPDELAMAAKAVLMA